MVKQHIQSVKTSGGKQLSDGSWRWDPVTWKKCWCGIYHSDRMIPSEFWEQKWEKRKGPKLTAGILLWKQVGKIRQFFMIQSYGNLYGFPKGSLEPEESYFDGALREFHEETGTKISLNKNKCLELRKVMGNNRISIFVVRVPSDYEIKTQPIADVEVSSYGFISELRIRQLKLNKVTKDILNIIEKTNNKLT